MARFGAKWSHLVVRGGLGLHFSAVIPAEAGIQPEAFPPSLSVEASQDGPRPSPGRQPRDLGEPQRRTAIGLRVRSARSGSGEALAQRSSAKSNKATPRRNSWDFGRSPEGPGAFSECPTAAGSCLGQAAFSTLPQPNPLDDQRQTLVHGSKLRLRVTCARKAPSAWPGQGRPPPTQPRCTNCSFATSLQVQRWADLRGGQMRGDKFVQAFSSPPR
jgi:hypothetical protein